MNALLRRFRPEQVRVLILLLIIVLALIIFGTQIENYFSPRFFNRIATSAAIVAVVAVGQTLIVLTRNIDLSVGSIVGITAYFVGTQLANNNDISPLLAVVMAMGLGAALGVINGLLVAYGRVPAIITTLGTLAIYRTLLVEYSGAKTVTTASLPEWLVNMPQLTLFSLGELDFRVLTVIAIVVVLIFQLALAMLPWGRRLYAIGSNPEAAHMVGLPVQRTIFSAFVICGALSGLAGFMFLSRFGNVTVVAAQGLELQVVAAVVVGGVNMFGGSGTVVGALLGTVLIDLLDQSLIRWLAISEFWRDAILGLLILLAVAADALLLKRLQIFWAQRLQAQPPQTGLPAERGSAMQRSAQWLRSWEGLLLILLLISVVFNALETEQYLSVGNVINLFVLSIEKIIIALIMVMIIINGEIDLSVASIMGLAACIMAALWENGVGVGWGIAAGLLAGLAAGAFNGYWIAYRGLPSLAVTLAGLIGYRGAARILLEDRSIGEYPEWFDRLGQQPLLGPMPLSIVVFIVLYLVALIILQFSAFGRYVYVIGNSQPVARYSGVKVQRVKMFLFMASGFVSALAGLLFAARLGSVRGDLALGFELDIITMVLLGGVSIFGGTGTLVGVGLSILLILNLRNGMSLANLSGHIQTGVVGVLLILSVLVPNLAQHVREGWRRRRYRRAAHVESELESDSHRPTETRVET